MNNFNEISMNELNLINGGGFWNDLGEKVGEGLGSFFNHAGFNKDLYDEYTRNKWGISFDTYKELRGGKL